MVITGLERFIENKDAFKAKKVGLVANQSSITSDYLYSFDLLRRPDSNMELIAIFSPEHGMYGVEQDMIPVHHQSIKGREEKPPIPIISLYGQEEESLKPLKKDIAPMDLVLFDLQDVGARYYTYIYTMSYCMEACAESKKKMFVLDRPNPINGLLMEGPLLEKDFASFVGRYPIPPRHGMTVGELAQLFNDSFSIGCELEVITMKGWKRKMWFDETALPWVPPSPNVPTLDTAIVYPGTCLIEGTNLSEGRGTCRPFEWIGAPWIEPEFFAEKLHQQNLPGVHFRPIQFTPKFHKWKDRQCGGVHIHVRERRRFLPFLTGVALIHLAFQLYPDQSRWREEPYEFVHDKLAFDLLAGSDQLRQQISSGRPLEEIRLAWDQDCQSFGEFRKEYLLYD